MRVAQFNFSMYGGSGDVASQLNKNFLQQNIDSKFYYLYKYGLRHNLIKDLKLSVSTITDNYLIKKVNSKVFYSNYRNITNKSIYKINFKNFDIIQLHWINGFISHNFIEKISKSKNVFWTIHDMEIMTGGCHYSIKCTKYLVNCSNCPIVNKPFKSFVEKNKAKKNAYDWTNVNFILPSIWLKRRFLESNLIIDPKKVHIIQNPIDAIFFKQTSKTSNRFKYGINEDEFVVIFISYWLKNPLKGLIELINILERIAAKSARKFTLICIGGNNFTKIKSPNIKIINTDLITDLVEMQNVISCGDIHVNLSEAESFGLTTAQCMAQNIPTLVLKDNAMAKVLKKYKLGFVANSSNDIFSIFDNLFKFDRTKLFAEHRLKSFALHNFSPNLVASKYLNLYRSINNDY